MQLGWIDFSKEDRQKALDVINLLSEQGAVDELGIGIIRDAFANYFFPGTSTVQTRAKYFLIVPYVLREAVDGRYGKDANRVLRAIDSTEKDCGIRLLEADSKAEGVIGTRVLPKGWVARKPSDIIGMVFAPMEYFVIMVYLFLNMFLWQRNFEKRRRLADLAIEMMMQKKMRKMIQMQEISAILDSGIFRFIMMIGETTLQ